jgi:transposase
VEQTSAALPEDLAAAHQIITSLRRENDWLRHRLDVLSRRLFGKKTEQLSPDQLALAYEQLENEMAKENAPVETDSGEGPTDEKPRPRRGSWAIPKDLRRVDVVVDIPEEQKTCATCGVKRELIGEDVSEKYDCIPAEVTCRCMRRLKYSGCACRPGVISAPAPVQAVEKGLATEGLLAHVLTSKYVDHQPLYRMEGILARHGVEVARKTLCDWVAECADALDPIYEHLRKTVVTVDYVQTDDTPVTVLKNGGGSVTGRLWVYLDPLGKRVFFEATPTRGRDGPERVLKDYKGYLQADAFGAYDALYRSGQIVEVGCWTHCPETSVIQSDGPRIGPSPLKMQPPRRRGARRLQITDYRAVRYASVSWLGRHRGCGERVSPACRQKVSSAFRFISRLALRYRPVVATLA